jgi:hypothetical protein
MTIDIKLGLVRQRAAILENLVELAGPQRDQARHLVEQLTVADKALAGLSAPMYGRFAAAEGHIQAILMYLDEIARPATKEEIVNALLEGGYLGAIPGTKLKIQKSIDNYLTGTGAKTRNYIRKVNGLIGKFEWDDALFEQRR